MIEEELRRILNSPERTLPVWPDSAERVRAGMRRRVRRAVLSGAAVVLALAGVGVTLALTLPQEAPDPTLAGGVVAWVDAPAGEGLPIPQPLTSTDAPPCAPEDLAQLDGQSQVRESPSISGLSLQVQNVGEKDCVLTSRPRAEKVTREGSPVGPPIPHEDTIPGSGPVDSIAIRPGESAQAWLLFALDGCEDSGAVHNVRIAVNGRELSLLMFEGKPVEANGGFSHMQCPATISGWSRNLAGPYSGLRATASGGSIKRGKDYVYYIELTNVTKVAVSLQQCPSYRQELQPSEPDTKADRVQRVHQLNCDRKTIEPGEVVRYQMKLRLPETHPIGAYTLAWKISGGPGTVLSTVLRPS